MRNLRNYYVFRRAGLRHAFRYAFGKSVWSALADALYVLFVVALMGVCMWYVLNSLAEEAEHKANVSREYQRELEKLAKIALTGGAFAVGNEWFILDKPVSIGEYK